MPRSSSAASAFPGSTRALIYTSFAFTGIWTTLLGPILPLLAGKFAVSDAQSGYLFSLQFTGSLVSVIAFSSFAVRCGFRAAFVAGFSLIAAAALGVAGGSWTMVAASVFAGGLGLGLIIPAANLAVTRMYPNASVPALALLNAIWCAGALACPPMLAVLLRRADLSVVLSGLSLLLGGMAAAFLLSRGTNGWSGTSRAAAAGAHVIERPSAVALLSGILLFLYVGAEASVSGWITSYALRLPSMPAAMVAIPQAAFWGGILAGRGLTVTVFARTPATTLVIAGVLMATAGMAAALTVTGAWLLVVGVAVTGIGLAPVFPAAVGVFSEHHGERATAQSGFIFALAATGGAVLPWLVGIVSSGTGSLRAGLALVLAMNLALVAVQSILIRFLRPRKLPLAEHVSA